MSVSQDRIDGHLADWRADVPALVEKLRAETARAGALQARIDAALGEFEHGDILGMRAALTEPTPAPEHDSECDYGKTFFGYLNTDCTCAAPAPEPPKLDPAPWYTPETGHRDQVEWDGVLGGRDFKPRHSYSQNREEYP